MTRPSRGRFCGRSQGSSRNEGSKRRRLGPTSRRPEPPYADLVLTPILFDLHQETFCCGTGLFHYVAGSRSRSSLVDRIAWANMGAFSAAATIPSGLKAAVASGTSVT